LGDFVDDLLRGDGGAVEKPSGYPPDPPKEMDYKIRPLDTLHISMYNENEVLTTVLVSKLGIIDLQLLDKVEVAGLTLYAAKEKLAALYSKYYTNPKLSIVVTVYAPRFILVDGYVGHTGPLYLTESQMTMAQAMGQVGIQPRGDRKNVRLTRASVEKDKDGNERSTQNIYKINVQKIMRGFAPDLPLVEGDKIWVEDSDI
jgi:polysaccharide export outer membrane protein